MKVHQVLLAIAASAIVAAPAGAAQGLSATATYTDTMLSPGEFQYDITLNNTGSSPIGVYWFSWVPGAGFLSAKPTNVVSPSGWTDTLSNNGAAIMWMTPSTPLAAGGKLTGFSFDSTETPAQVAGMVMGTPVATSYVYSKLPNPITITSLTKDGAVFVTTASTSSTPPTRGVPEPATLALFGLGLAGLAVGRKKTKR